ncbi:PREDICTED: proteasome-associated protein ECM29 homolog isoform X1 [Papilio xuthus]|uniref:Proteasome-associated protein ECM29 homolog isoform X1 n=1 Tax=Papilio xuthus TaxID=66420 RepID=A0AAJ6ZRK1_PAPXU|nr:PREDICTED: proteasome-associated protein ECM29 homolog isoform X1 [Papilio xuthus]
MSEMEVTETGNDCSNDLLLLDRVFLRLGNVDTDEQLESCLNRFLPPVILKLSSPHEQVRTKVMELLVHVNKRIKCRADVQLPVQTLLQLYKDPAANSFIINFSKIYITMGFPRLPREQQLSLTPSLLEAIENKPQPHQDGILMLVMPLLGDIKETDLNLKEKPKVSSLILKFALDILLLPYRALPHEGESEFQVPPGMSMKTYKRIVGNNQLNPNQLEEMKLSIVNFISKDIFNMNDILLTLIVAAADSRFSVANHANSPLIRVNSSVDWSQPAVVGPLYSLYLGTWGGMKAPSDDRKVAACTRLRLKLIQYLNKATGPAIMFPHCVQVVFSSLFDANTNSRLRNMALMFLLNVINNGDSEQLKKVGVVFLHGLLKLIRSDEYSDHHSKAYMCLGRLALKCPETINKQFILLEEFVKKIPEAVPEMKTALRDALLDMSYAYSMHTPEGKEEAMETSAAGTSNDMDVDEASESKKPRPNPYDEPQALALYALLDHYMHSEDSMIRYIAMRYSSVVFPQDYVPSRYLLLLASGDTQDDIVTESQKCLYGTSRASEIEDVVNNVSKKETAVVNLDEGPARKDNESTAELKTPSFKDVVNYVWEQIQKRKKGSNSKHRYVIGNHLLQFHPKTYQEILRYMRMCLNRDAKLKDCSNHPNSNSPLLAKYFRENLLETEVLERYLTMITSLLNACPELMPLTCFLDIVGCVPEIIASKYVSLLPFLMNLFTTSTKEDIRDIAAVIYAIITANTSNKSAIEKEIKEFVAQSRGNKGLEAQCGYISAFSHLCERCIALSKRGKFGGKGFNPSTWEPYQDGALCLGNFLASPQTLLVSTSVSSVSLLVRCSALPLPNMNAKQEAMVHTDNPFNVNHKDIVTDDEVTKYTVAERLFRIVGNPSLPSKVKERALYTLGLMCCGERLIFAKQIVKGFLQMAKDSKEFEIHLQIGESLVLCAEGVNSNENRDLWTELPREGDAKIRDLEALKENDELLQWLLQELFKIGKHPHPHSRQATSIWLLALLKNCSDREPIRNSLQLLQNVFMDYLSENSDIVQDVASKGLSLVYQNSDESRKQALVGDIIEQLTSGKRSVAQVTDDTKIFEEGQLGKAPTGGNLSTYKELCSLASDLNQPDLLYKFMHLAHHNSVWNSKKGAAFGFHSIALQAGAQLTDHLPKIVPRLYRYRFDPTPRIQHSMAAIWHAIVPNTQHTVQKYHKEILDDLVANLTSNQWRVRMSCCNALSDLLRGAKSLHESLEQLPTIWSQLFRVMDDVHEGTRLAATATATVLSKLCVQACDVAQGKDGKRVVDAILPVLLDNGITNLVKEVRSVSLLTVSRLVTSCGEQVSGFVSRLVPALVCAAGELESARLSHLSTVLADSSTREVLDDLRANATKHHYTTDTVVKCMPYITIDSMKEMLPKMLELMKSPQLGTKVACAHFIVLSAHYLRTDLEPVAGKLMTHLLNGAFDRNPTVRKNYAEALGQVSAFAKSQSIEKLMKKLINLYETKEDDVSRSAVALMLRAVAKAKADHLKDNEEILAPVVFLAMHAPKDEESSTVEMFEELWSELSPARESGMRRHLPALRAHLEAALAATSWTKKIQGATAIKTLCAEVSCGLGTQREPLLRAALAAAHGKTFDGKHHLLDALADLCTVKEGEAPLNPTLASECVNALLAECRKPDPGHKRRALAALGRALAATHCDVFQHVYDIVKVILSKDESSMDKDSDDEDNEGARRRAEQLTALKEAAYELLGNAWPKDPQTQDKYQEEFFEHCAQCYASSTRSTQLAVLRSMASVLPRLEVLRGRGQPMDTDTDNATPTNATIATDRDKAITNINTHAAKVVDYTLKNSNQVRHRKDALNILEILIKQLTELNKTEELNILKEIYHTYAPDLAKDSSHELRTKVESIKTYINK